MDYYTYAYLREDLTPYYVGKGRGKRAFLDSRWNKPKDISRIMFLREGMSEKDALKHEAEMIKTWGRKDLGTGILRNRTDGGDGVSGYKHSDEARARISFIQNNRSYETRARLSLANKGKKRTAETKEKMRLAQIGNKNKLGKKCSKESREKIRLGGIGNQNHLGHRHTEESKAKMGLGSARYWSLKKLGQ